MLKSFDNADQTRERARLDAMLDRLSKSNDPQRALLKEHFSTARNYIQGEMPEEYALNLDLSRQALPAVEDADLRHELRTGIEISVIR